MVAPRACAWDNSSSSSAPALFAENRAAAPGIEGTDLLVGDGAQDRQPGHAGKGQAVMPFAQRRRRFPQANEIQPLADGRGAGGAGEREHARRAGKMKTLGKQLRRAAIAEFMEEFRGLRVDQSGVQAGQVHFPGGGAGEVGGGRQGQAVRIRQAGLLQRLPRGQQGKLAGFIVLLIPGEILHFPHARVAQPAGIPARHHGQSAFPADEPRPHLLHRVPQARHHPHPGDHHSFHATSFPTRVICWFDTANARRLRLDCHLP